MSSALTIAVAPPRWTYQRSRSLWKVMTISVSLIGRAISWREPVRHQRTIWPGLTFMYCRRCGSHEYTSCIATFRHRIERTMSVREFKDSQGRDWRAWDVVPDNLNTRIKN